MSKTTSDTISTSEEKGQEGRFSNRLTVHSSKSTIFRFQHRTNKVIIETCHSTSPLLTRTVYLLTNDKKEVPKLGTLS